MTAPVVLTAGTADELQAIAERLGRVLAIGDVVGLHGPLGAGKTTFVQGLARGLGVRDRHVASPTFALVNEHPGRVPLVHADLYRIESRGELEELGLAEAPDRAVLAVEWLDRFPEVAPTERLDVEIAIGGGGVRQLTFRAIGVAAKARLAVFADP